MSSGLYVNGRYTCPISITLIFPTVVRKRTQISNLKKICPLVVKLFESDGRTDRHDERSSSFSQLCESA